MDERKALRRRADYVAVYERGRAWADRRLVVKVLPNASDTTRFGYSVGKGVGKAVVRNKVRRRLREIVRQTAVMPGWDVVVIARPESSAADFQQLKQSVAKLLLKSRLTKEEDERPGPGTH